MSRIAPCVLLLSAIAAAQVADTDGEWPPVLLPRASHPLAPRAHVITLPAAVKMTLNAVAGDTQGNLYIAGHSTATDIPGLARGFQPKPTGTDALVVKVNARGEVLWSTYLGGRDRQIGPSYFDPTGDGVTAIVVDAGGNIYVAGFTAALNFPFVNAFNTSPNSYDADGFIAKISADGQRLLYSSYLIGGPATGLVAGPAGEVWVSSGTATTKLNPAGSPIWTRRHGLDVFYGDLGVDGVGRVYVGGRDCRRNPLTGEIHECRTTVTQFDTSGTAVGYEATFVESGRLFFPANRLAVTPDGRVVVAGLSCRAALPVRRSPGVIPPDCSIGDRSAWVVTLGTSGEVESVTYADTGNLRKIAADAEGRVLLLSTEAPPGLSTMRALVDHHVDGPLYISGDRGATWRAGGPGIATPNQVLDLDYDAGRKSLYATLDDVARVYESPDAGRTWQRDRRAASELPPDAKVFVPRPTGLAIDRRDPSTRYAPSASGILRHDANSDWEVALPGAWFPVETNPIDGTVWTATRGLFAVSADSGRSWERKPLRTPDGASLLPSSIVFHPTRRGTVYLGANDLWVSYDNGESWRSLTEAIQPRPAITAIAIDSMSNILYAGSVSRLGVLRSVDDGRTWTATLTGHRITAIAVDPSRPNLVYAGGSDPANRGVMYRSNDRGESWERIMNGLNIRSEVTQLLLDPRDPSRLYVGTRLGAVPFIARLVPSHAFPGRVRTPAAATGLARTDFASYLGHGAARAVATTPTGSILVGLELPSSVSPFTVRRLAVAVIEDVVR